MRTSKVFSILLGVVLGVSLTYAALAMAATVETVREAGRFTSPVIDAQAFNSGKWTGWLQTGSDAALCFDIFHDYTGNAGVTMRCETADDSSTANDAGYDVTTLDVASGTATSKVLTFSHATGADARWSWCLGDLSGQYINCYFDDTSGDNGTDTVTVTVKGISP